MNAFFGLFCVLGYKVLPFTIDFLKTGPSAFVSFFFEIILGIGGLTEFAINGFQ